MVPCKTDDDDDPSTKPFNESEDDFVEEEEPLVVSDKAGHKWAPITGSISAAPFDGCLFHGGFLLPALPFPHSAPLSSSAAAAAAAASSITDVDCEDDDDTNAIGSRPNTGHGPPGWPEPVATLLSIDGKSELVILLAVAIKKKPTVLFLFYVCA